MQSFFVNCCSIAVLELQRNGLGAKEYIPRYIKPPDCPTTCGRVAVYALHDCRRHEGFETAYGHAKTVRFLYLCDRQSVMRA